VKHGAETGTVKGGWASRHSVGTADHGVLAAGPFTHSHSVSLQVYAV